MIGAAVTAAKAFKHWRGVGIGLAFAASLGFGGVQTVRLSGEQSAHSATKVDLAKSRTALAELTGKVSGQNASIDAWQAVAADRKEQAVQLGAIAREAAARRESRATTILREAAPANVDECRATLELLRKYQTNAE